MYHLLFISYFLNIISCGNIPLGQKPSIVSTNDDRSLFIIYNSALGLGSIYCPTNECLHPIKHVQKSIQVYNSFHPIKI